MQQWKARNIEVNYKTTLIQPNDVVLGMIGVSLLHLRNRKGNALVKVMLLVELKPYVVLATF